MSVLRMQRSFAATRERVFSFLTQTDHLLNWWGPDGTTITDHDLDFSRPGPWVATMHSPGGDAHRVGGDVLAIDPPASVELTLAFIMPDGARGPLSTILFELTDQGGGMTRLTLTQSGLKAEHIQDMRNKGWNAAFARLGKLIEQS